ncbi:MAG: hypothetical protein DA408_09625 [Bacteroidetes bacterium]|nr:MAG: hypothetical protein C7N36_04830 [Bacteroidota bacterium]PTM12658.1 MAG: hypothetical protein DA408_09625 [Bacteroidota bacterium]
MNAENYAEYLAQPAKLYQLPYQEIKNLVEEYPFSANLRWLLTVKSKIEHDPKFEQHLHQLAAHTFDRKKLYQLVNEDLQKLLDLDVVERLELKDLAQLAEAEKIPVVRPPEQPAAPAAQMTMSPPPPPAPGTLEYLDEDDFFLPAAPPPLPGPPPASSAPPPAELPAVAPPPEENEQVQPEQVPALTPATEPLREIEWEIAPPTYLIPAEMVTALIGFSILPQEKLAPLPTTVFDSWNSLREQDQRRQLVRLRQRAVRGSSTPTPQKARQVAKKSLQEQPDLASETLADLLARQGQYAKAIKIYQRLSLLNPEKSVYFAATIENLKQKL